jgi:cation diffusion facilitator CzcD-associated flavoprotein CzcO
VLDTGYFETFNRPNVTVVDLRNDGIQAITESGIRTNSGHIDLDVIVFATGFDAMTGALDRIDIRGRDGRSLRDEWASEGVKSLLGLQVAGYPNLFTVNGPGSPSVVANMATTIEHHVEWITACLLHLRENGLSTIEATAAAQDAWADRVNEVASKTMYTAPTCNSWYLGTNIPGKRRQFLPFVGGLNSYIAVCDDIAREEYPGFRRA